MVQSILATFCGCMPAGIAAIVFSSQASSKQSVGDYYGAMEAAKKAKLFCFISLGVAVAVAVLYVLVALAASGGSNY